MTTRHYLGIVEPGEDCWGISFPAFPGTTSLADSFGELMLQARDALATVVGAFEEEGKPLPPGVEEGTGQPEYDLANYEDPHLVLVPIDVGGKAIRINVTMEEGLVARLDHLAQQAHSSRSALLARGARLVLAAEAAE